LKLKLKTACQDVQKGSWTSARGSHPQSLLPDATTAQLLSVSINPQLRPHPIVRRGTALRNSANHCISVPQLHTACAISSTFTILLYSPHSSSRCRSYQHYAFIINIGKRASGSRPPRRIGATVPTSRRLHCQLQSLWLQILTQKGISSLLHYYSHSCLTASSPHSESTSAPAFLPVQTTPTPTWPTIRSLLT